MNKLIFSVLISPFVFLCLEGFPSARDCGSGPAPALEESKYRYLLYLPKEYEKERAKKWPLLIFLHGKSLRGNNLERLKRYGLPEMINRGKEFPFIVASPQCPLGTSWNNDGWFIPLYRELTQKYRIDRNRIYLIGMSLGGYGVWYTAIRYPEYFAAIMPLCGGGDAKKVCRIKHIPVWTFHGKEDRIVLPEESRKMVRALERCGGNIRFTLLEAKGHDLHRVFHDNKIYMWLLKHRKSDNNHFGKPSEKKRPSVR
jgi:predicted peptidase